MDGKKASNTKPTILLVEDEKDLREALALRLAVFAQVLEAGSGKEALLTLAENAHIKLIITDLEMPEMNGLQFIESLKHTNEPHPIVVISGSVDESQSNKLRQLGVKAILGKPFEMFRLEKLILSLLK